MSNPPVSPDRRAVLKDALLRLEEMQAKIDRLEGSAREPIAVIGVGCRFPGGASGPEAYWNLLRSGGDAIREVPPERWDLASFYDPDPSVAGKIYTRFGGFLDNVSGFDADFFGMAPREAVKTDPQQRLLLEVAWEALEDAALSPESLDGSPTGVFVGVTGNDYAQHLNHGGPESIDAYNLTGGCLNFAAGRLSYVLGLRGPALAVDTACSSSLVAVHLACQSLRSGECRVALSAGVNVILSPEMSIAVSKARMLAPDGRCKTFDAAADGFVRGEGCGVVVLKRLSDALADGDRVHGLIRGSAVNQDGRTSGLTVPNKLAQESLIRAALLSAGVAPAQVGYVEAHGTGTALGDPIEVRALAAALGDGRAKGQRFLLGSAKTNIGHLESAAGVAGLIKVLLALEHQEIPPHLHFTEPNPYVNWDEVPAVIPDRLTPWPSGPSRRIAGVSSFGASGTNAHLVVEEAHPAAARPSGVDRPLHVLCVSAATEAALRDVATRLGGRLSGNTDPLPDLCYTANTGRSHLAERAVLVTGSQSQVLGQLEALASGGEAAGLRVGRRPIEGRTKIAFLFTGQGAQYVGMGRALYETQPTFRRSLDRCEELLRGSRERSLLSVLYPSGDPDTALDETAYTQPALFALEYALAELWRSWGIEPTAVMGHSVGEYVAACVAGVFSLEDGLRLIAERGRLMQALPRGGAMTAVLAGEERVRSALQAHAGRVSIAAVNGPDNVVISGLAESVDAVAAALGEEGIRCKALPVSHAFHSHLMEPMLDAFEREAAAVRYAAPRIDLISNVTGRVAGPGEMSAGYWRRHVREAVLFEQSMETLERAGYDMFLEIGPSPTLLGMGKRCVEREGGAWLPSLRKGRGDWETILDSVAALHVGGVRVDWKGFDRDYSRRKVTLPTYPFQHERYWFENARTGGAPRARETRPGSPGHPLLGRRRRSATKERVFESQIGTDALPFLADHRVEDAAVVPATAYVELGLAVAASVFGDRAGTIEDLFIAEPLVLAPGDSRNLQTTVALGEAGRATFQVWSLGEEEDDESRFRMHAQGTLTAGDPGPPLSSPEPPEALQAGLGNPVDVPGFYAGLEARGVRFGPAFRGIEGLWVGSGEALARVRLPAAQEAAAQAYHFHPALLDACFQLAGATLPVGEGREAETFLPMVIDRVRVHARPGDVVWSHARVRPAEGAGGQTVSLDLRIFDSAGRVIAEVAGLHLKRLPPGALRARDHEQIDDWLYEVQWQARPLAEPAEAPPADYIPPPTAITERLRPRLGSLAEAQGIPAYNRALDDLEALSTDYVGSAMHGLGWHPHIGDTITTEGLAERLGVVPAQRRLFGRFLEMLHEDGVLEPSEGAWRVRRKLVPARVEDLAGRASALLARDPSCEAQVTLVRRCGETLAASLHGDCDPLQILFPAGSVELAEGLNQKTPFARYHNSVIGDAIAEVVAALPPGRRLRILEIGAGTGSTSSYVLPKLPADRTDYVFTDLSPLFTARAATKFREYPFVRYQIFDAEKDPGSQGMGPEQFDVVIAANVIHATRDLRDTLSHVRQVLAPRGLLILLEATQVQRWVDVTFGLTDGWWRFTDTDRRPTYPLLPQSGWREVLAASGFAETAMLPEERDPGHQLAVMFARAPARVRTAQPGAASRRWLILEDATGVGRGLSAALRERGDAVTLVRAGSTCGPDRDGSWTVDPSRPEHFLKLVTSGFPEGSGRRGVIHLWGLDARPPQATTVSTLDEDGILGSASVLHLVQALSAAGEGDPPRLVTVTRSAQAVGPQEDPEGLSQSPVWGLGKVVALEHPELRCVRVDLGHDPDDLEALCQEVLSGDGEDQVALRATGRFVARLVRSEKASVTAQPAEPRRLEVSERGVLENLRLAPASRRPPGPGEVEIQVRATGLNFRDVLNALGMYPGDAGPLGGECTGRISAVGDGVRGLALGDEVVALAPASFATFVTAPAQFVLPKPEPLSLEEGATVPSTFLTAHYALNHLARMKRGERVLVHAGAGGVGLSAVQLAQRAGAVVFATAGSDEKREYLRSLGVDHVLNSRTLDFAEEILRLTNGLGVDVVLNSLSGEFIPKSLSLLSAGGRFLEIGKRGIWSEDEVAKFRLGVSYFAFDLLEVAHREPVLIRALLEEVLEAFRTKDLRPLPRREFPFEEAVAAFRYMAQARHIGKVVVTQRPLAEDGAARFRKDATYLITGGLGGLGLLLTRWMVDQGARNLVLLGRTGPDAVARGVIQDVEARGGRVVVAQADVSRDAEVSAVFERIQKEMPPLRGVIHAAGALDDGVLQQQDWNRFRHVMAAKVAGSWILHQHTRGMPLDLFVLFSSAVSLVGRPGQGNHAAANAFMDTLAHHRRAQGLPGLSINWGAWGEVGAAVRGNLPERMMLQGIGTIPPDQGLVALGRLLERAPAQVAVFPVDWSRFFGQFQTGREPRLLSELAAETRRKPEAEASVAREPDLQARLLTAAPAKRATQLLSFVREQAVKVLGLDASRAIDPRRPLGELGLDSLMAVELRNALGMALKRNLPATLLFDYPTLHALSGYLSRVLFPETTEGDAVAPEAARARAVEDLQAITDEQAEALLLEELAAARKRD